MKHSKIRSTLFIVCFAGVVFSQIRPVYGQFTGRHGAALNEAAGNFYDKDWRAAITNFETIIDSIDQAELGGDAFVLANMYLLFSHFSLAQPKKSTEIAKRILRVNQHVVVDSSTFILQYIEVFENEKARVLGTLEVTTDPPGAAVYLNDQFVGAAPVDTVLIEDRYELKVESPGYKIKIDGISVIADQPNTFSYSLKKRRGTWRWYALGASAVLGGGVFILTNSESRPDLPAPPSLSGLDDQ